MTERNSPNKGTPPISLQPLRCCTRVSSGEPFRGRNKREMIIDESPLVKSPSSLKRRFGRNGRNRRICGYTVTFECKSGFLIQRLTIITNSKINTLTAIRLTETYQTSEHYEIKPRHSVQSQGTKNVICWMRF